MNTGISSRNRDDPVQDQGDYLQSGEPASQCESTASRASIATLVAAARRQSPSQERECRATGASREEQGRATD